MLLDNTGCYGYWCAPCLFGQNVENLGPVRWSGDQVRILDPLLHALNVLLPSPAAQMANACAVMQAAPSIIPCWAAGLTFGVLQFLPMLSHKTAGIYTPWVLHMLYRRRIRQHYKMEVSSNAFQKIARTSCT